MRGISYFASSNSARAFMLCAMLVAGATFNPLRAQESKSTLSPADHDNAQSEETAFATPHSASPGGPNGLPHPLSASDAALLKEAFRAQRAGDFETAISRARSAHDSVLTGDLLAERYLNPAYHPQPAQLRLWLKTFSGLADAGAIHALLVSLSPRGSVPSQNFPTPLAPTDFGATPWHAAPDPLARILNRNPLLDRTVNERISWGLKGGQSAVRLVDATPGMTPLYAAQLRAEIALGMLSTGEAGFALETARTGFIRSKHQLGYAGYVAGLAAWRQGRIREALGFFEQASRARTITNETRAAASYWAGRAHRRLDDRHGLAQNWFQRAASETGTFYGILARQTLGVRHAGATPEHADMAGGLSADDETALNNPIPVMGEIDVEAVAATPQGRRLFALLQIGEAARAEALLRRMWPDIVSDPALCHSVQLVAAAAGLHDLSEQIATILAARDGRPAHLAGFPTPHLAPRHGFKMDPALVYALTRLESNFDPKASSSAGAHGLMQIRPLTASFVSGPKPSLDAHGVAIINVPPDMIGRLHNPAVNLEIGQLYVQYLAGLSERSETAPRGGDLIHTLASYNAGPGAIARWENASQKESDLIRDPLLFMELLPNGETRDYVHHALAYLWIYADKLDLPAPSLRALSHAEWPCFADERAIASTHAVTYH
ncbi:lytic transglycosylase domain-containing protein [Swaminathania salitolerans]|uniref:Lytic transglycosylase n=1 Tax=Swaminathania salitolerans TaxID=182838 RepID=A0A511BQI8_9PROT|nr:lytic transglycosylase domain-containing protein [Swaminathania salitolerans]GBQ11725.1 lytic murein transglycosylase [Swaminathania salitolerans LMG 21291]GEL02600.1 lytic transglycosylase [Swaminathania salitolerans]